MPQRFGRNQSCFLFLGEGMVGMPCTPYSMPIWISRVSYGEDCLKLFLSFIHRFLPTCESFFSKLNVSHSKVSCEGHVLRLSFTIFEECVFLIILLQNHQKYYQGPIAFELPKWIAKSHEPQILPKHRGFLKRTSVHRCPARPLVEKMANSSFKTDHTVPLLEKAHALKAQQAARKAAEKGWS